MHQEYFQQQVQIINQSLDKYMRLWEQETTLRYPKLTDVISHFVTANEGGKRLRAALVLTGYEMITGYHNLDIIPVALAYELFQTAILTHDDIIDLSDLRRGKSTLHKSLESRGISHLGLGVRGGHYGVSHSICLADVGLFLAQQLIIESTLSDSIKVQAAQSFLQSCIDTGLGEMLDVELSYLDHNTITESDIMSVYRDKTARYTVTGPLLLGAICAGADEDTLKAIQLFGDNLGVAFQIKDDEIGIYQSETVSGKTATSDIVEGKYTLLYHHALHHGSDMQISLLQSLYGREVNTNEHQQVQHLFEEIGSRNYSDMQVKHYVDIAIEQIPHLTSHDTYREHLHQLALFMINRTH